MGAQVPGCGRMVYESQNGGREIQVESTNFRVIVDDVCDDGISGERDIPAPQGLWYENSANSLECVGGGPVRRISKSRSKVSRTDSMSCTVSTEGTAGTDAEKDLQAAVTDDMRFIFCTEPLISHSKRGDM